MKTFYDWWTFLEEEQSAKEDQPSHTRTLRDTLKVNPSALIGMTIPFSGDLRGKRYNMVGLVVKEFDDDENPTRVKLSMFNNSPNMDAQVRFSKGEQDKDKDKDEYEINPDEDDIDISLEEFDEILGKGWEPAAQAAAAGGAGGSPGGMPGGLGM